MRELAHLSFGVSRCIGVLVACIVAIACSSSTAAQQSSFDLRVAERRPAGDPEAPWQAVTLPDPWNGAGRVGLWEYRVPFAGAAAGTDPWVLYVPRAGNRLAVAINGRLIGRLGRFDGDQADHAQQPHAFFVPADALSPIGNELRLVIEGDPARYAGLSSMRIGLADEVMPEFRVRQAVQVWGSFAIILVSLTFALVSGSIAVVLRNGTVALFSLACALCAIRTCFAVVNVPPFDYRLWDAVVEFSYAGYVTCICVFATRTLDIPSRLLRWLPVVFGAAVTVLIPLYAFGRILPARQAWLMAAIVFSLIFTGSVIRHWLQRPSRSGAVMVIASLAGVGLGLRDHLMVFFSSDGYGTFSLARYALLVFQLAMGWVLLDWYSSGQRAAAELRARVAIELAERRMELERHFDVQQALASVRAQQTERQRIMQDLHDGLGLQLHGLLGMVERQAPGRSDLSREVRTAIEQMRMLVDSTESFDGDFPMLLGHVRHMIARRLRAVGIELRWDVVEIDPGRRLKPDHAIALQRLLFELTTNTMKHAAAARVTIRVRNADAGAVVVDFEDDGVGYDPATLSGGGLGMRSIQRRVAEIGAALSRRDVPQGTAYRLCLSPRTFVVPDADEGTPVPGDA